MLKQTFIYFAITLLLTILLAIVQGALQISFEQVLIPQLAPALGVFLLSWWQPALKPVLNFEINTLILPKILLALGLPFLLFSVGFGACKWLNVSVSITENWVNTLPLLTIGMAVGALGEEIGWRGFLQPHLEKKYAILPATLILGGLWGLWHIGHYSKGALFLGSFLVFTAAASIVLRSILADTRFNIIIATVFHLAINICFVLFFKTSLSDSKMMLINAFIWAVAAVFFVKIRKNYSFYLRPIV